MTEDNNIRRYIEEKKLSYLLEYLDMKYSKDFEDRLCADIKKNFYDDRI
tara:strand:+ start:332 stop:478 length:147 start_codon:yes stop_codon:yes gene_type:complete